MAGTDTLTVQATGAISVAGNAQGVRFNGPTNGASVQNDGSIADTASGGRAIGAGDYNGDGKADILWQNNDGTAAVWLMNGTSLISGANVGTDPGTN
jgi:hypothetical protein